MADLEIRSQPRDSRPRRTRLGTAIRLSVVAVVASISIVIGIVGTDHPLLSRSPPPPPPPVSARPIPRPPASPAGAIAATTTSTSAPSHSAEDSTPRRADDAELDAQPSLVPLESRTPELQRLLAAMDEAVVKLETAEPGAPRALGSGFVVDARGLVATSLHVLAESTAATARFKNGAGYEVAGYVAVEPEWDLAIVQLRDPPPHLRPLPLAELGDPGRLSNVIAIGHPRGVEFSPFDGKVSRVLTTTELPPASQRFLRRLITGRADHRWIQHTAAIAEGNSGGPLLDEQARVIGINTWVDNQAHFGYALHVDHLRELLERVGAPVEPLSRYARADARVGELLRRLTPERLEELAAAAQRMNWRPETEADYEVLQELAWAITVVQVPSTLAGRQLDERLDDLARIVDRVVQELTARRWDAIGQMTIINEHAVTQIDRPMAGLFLFATIERVVEGDQGERGALLRMEGVESTLFVPLDGQLTVPAPGQQCLVVGLNYGGNKLRYGDNPLKLITAHIVASRNLIPLRE